MKKPKVSVVVPFYNRSRFLVRLLDSVYSQGSCVSEVFIVDNGSSIEEVQRAWGIIQRHLISDTCCFVSTVSTGNANYARNLGYRLSNSPYVAFLDSDDWWAPDHLRNSIDILESSGKVGCYSGAIIHTPNKVSVARSVDIDLIGCPFKFLFARIGGSAQTSSFVISKKLLKYSVEWDESLKRSQDHDYFISIQKRTKGWVYKSQPEYYIDWCQGGAEGPVDVDSIVNFYRKWAAGFPQWLNILFLLKYISVFEARGMGDKIGKLTQCANDSFFNRLLFSSVSLYILRRFFRVRAKLKVTR